MISVLKILFVMPWSRIQSGLYTPSANTNAWSNRVKTKAVQCISAMGRYGCVGWAELTPSRSDTLVGSPIITSCVQSTASAVLKVSEADSPAAQKMAQVSRVEAS